ncbi:autotransporter [Devosia sp. DBB001]|nr:autotransporter [Devosia sp. DBB001]
MWLSVSGSGAGTITASDSTLTGTAITEAGSTSTLVLKDDTTWSVTGNSNVTNLTNNDSLIDFVLGPDFRTLTTVNYGGSGGTLGVNTSFGPTTGDQKSDVLQVDGGQATGATQVDVKAVNPENAVPTQGNGILLVNAINGATTAENAFFTDGTVAAGPYEYELFRGGIGGADPENWYLRTGGGITDPCEPEPGDGDGGDGNGGNGGEDVAPLRPEVSLYSDSPVLTWLYGSMVLDTMHQRKGDDWRNGPHRVELALPIIDRPKAKRAMGDRA